MSRDGSQKRSLFREVNERIRDVNRSFGFLTDTYQILCECAGADCTLQLVIPGHVYEDVRGNGLFVVARGHECADEVRGADTAYAVVSPAVA